MIQNLTVPIETDSKIKVPVLLVTIVPGVYSKPENLTMNYSISSYSATSLTIQLKFENVAVVSSKAPDQVKVVFIGN
jgi:hypothetical protein